MNELTELATRYEAFAEYEAKGVSATYESYARRIASSHELLQLVATLPREKQQPNLILGSARWVAGLQSGADEFAQIMLSRWDAIRETALARNTQTNEPARCACFVPLLAELASPLALLEVGASAGLCLLPDLYRYRVGTRILSSLDSAAGPIFEIETNDASRFPDRVPSVMWRCGLDLNPIDLGDDTAVQWLRCLVWPGQDKRLALLNAAIKLARAAQPEVRQGDLLEDLDHLVRSVPTECTLVVFHSAVLSYVSSQRDRDRFAESVQKLGAVWISNEGPSVFPWITDKIGRTPRRDRFILSINGEPVAQTSPHGTVVEWI